MGQMFGNSGPAGGIPGISGGARPQESPRKRAIDEARACLMAQNPAGAVQALDPILKRGKPGAEVLMLMAATYEMLRRIPQAMDTAKRSLALFEHPDTLLVLARCYRVTGETAACLDACDRALKMQPGAIGALHVKGAALEEAGRFDEARAVIGPLMEAASERGEKAEPGVSFEWAKLLVHAKEYEEAIRLLDEILADNPAENLRLVAHHLSAKARDKLRDYRGAYEQAELANAIGKLDFSPELYEEQVSVLIENWSREAMERFPVSTCESAVPVFVAGMPRSGTSLIDQIIHAHPKAAGVGELESIEKFAQELAAAWDPDKEPPACFGRFDAYRWTRAARDYVRQIEKLSPGAERIVNKALGNNKLVGLIARLFPNTRIIHAIRDPRDVAISCFMGGFNNQLHPWTTQIDWAARAWEQSMRMMEHWKASLDVPVLDVYYENLVNDPDTEFPRIIEFLGLEWDDACREFHKSRRTVRTLSYDQVNRPLYTSSAGRHVNYAEFIEGIEFPPYTPPAP